MPSPPFKVPDLVARGPRIQVEISWPEMVVEDYRAHGKSVPEPIVVSALVDTGANCTAIAPSARAKLSLPELAVRPVSGATGVKACPVYVVRLVPLVGADESPRRVFDPWPVVGTEPALDYECILGRDVLDGAVFKYDGPGKCFDISFQSSSEEGS